MISAPNSNSGKTIISAALLYSLKKRGFDISGFKTGPDQVDRKILEKASGKPAGNIDLFMMGKQGIRTALSFTGSEYAIIEGVMGCFDGIGTSFENSSFSAAEELDINIILVYTPMGEMFTMIPKLKGMLDFASGRICAIILNKINEKMFRLYKNMIEETLGLNVLGFFPNEEKLKIEETGLGLSLNDKLMDLNFLNLLDSTVNTNIDIDNVIQLFKETEIKQLKKYNSGKKIKTAVALDTAINLYYSENIFLLNTLGNLEYFSPLKDKELPACDFLYLGSGNIKPFARQLSANKKMCEAVKSFAEKGGYILAEGESASYLFEQFDGADMCGIFKGSVESTKRLHNFGYKFMECTQDLFLGKSGAIIPAAEYHKSKAITDEKPVFKITKPKNTEIFYDGYNYKNTLAIFQNIHFLSCIESIKDLS